MEKRGNNLKDIDVRFLVGRLSMITGISGSGKSTLMHDVLLPAVKASLGSARAPRNACVEAVYEVDQSPIGKHRASERGALAIGCIQRSKTPLAAQTWRSMFPAVTMEKPSARGPSPGRKAIHALGSRLNRKPKRPPPLPSKKKISVVGRTANR